MIGGNSKEVLRDFEEKALVVKHLLLHIRMAGFSAIEIC